MLQFSCYTHAYARAFPLLLLPSRFPLPVEFLQLLAENVYLFSFFSLPVHPGIHSNHSFLHIYLLPIQPYPPSLRTDDDTLLAGLDPGGRVRASVVYSCPVYP